MTAFSKERDKTQLLAGEIPAPTSLTIFITSYVCQQPPLKAGITARSRAQLRGSSPPAQEHTTFTQQTKPPLFIFWTISVPTGQLSLQ